MLNVTPDHMDRYATIEEYAAAKARIFQHCDAAVINLDDPLVRAMPHQRAARARLQSARRSRRATTTRIQPGDDVALMHGRERSCSRCPS